MGDGVGWNFRVLAMAEGLSACLRGRLVAGQFFNWRWWGLHAAAGRVSPRRATYLFVARQKARGKNVPYIQRPRKLRVANLSGQPALGVNAGAQTNSLRAKALRSNSVCESEHEVWLSFGSQTAGVCSERRRWLKGVGEHPGQPTANSQQPTANSQQPNSRTAEQPNSQHPPLPSWCSGAVAGVPVAEVGG